MSKKRGQKYDRIIEAAVTVIAKYGFHQAQVAKIAKEAGVADGTIYLYFKNKEDILISLFEEKMGAFVAESRRKIGLEQTAKEKLRVLVHAHFTQLEADFHLAVVTQLELRQSKPELRLKINHVLKGYLSLLDELIQEGKDSGLFSSELDRLLARQMVFGTLDEVVSNWVMAEGKFSLAKQTEKVQKMLLDGLVGKAT
ncbi:TetR/AcrR family transcriptional regulator [Shouchella lonarensis]|uniref:Transcriptional regulator, TetR family n=1 Tax=Shouchella lonarensis TaxID=1464122 RepID=A0A1G6K3J2_9BACI|nr:TetR/AcrR family transcriptional regulator [Shouchella lonarensis]SDC25497.1 transcriptional regulator, TetR family [Shouchella lonarensis]